jgi:hypothetical protein
LCTLRASDRVVCGSDRAEFRMFAGGAQCLRARECRSSPTSGTYFPCSGACEPLNVYKSPLMGPCGGPFLLVAAGLAATSLGLDSGVAVYSFMAGSAWNCMTWGSNPQGHPCRQPEFLGNFRFVQSWPFLFPVGQPLSKWIGPSGDTQPISALRCAVGFFRSWRPGRSPMICPGSGAIVAIAQS